MPFTYGVAFSGTDGKSIFVQSGDHGTDEMDRMVQYDVTSGWHPCKSFVWCAVFLTPIEYIHIPSNNSCTSTYTPIYTPLFFFSRSNINNNEF